MTGSAGLEPVPTVEPPPSRWRLPPPHAADDLGVVGVGADLEPGTLLAAYRSGLFPMPMGRRRLGWWSPDPRAVLPLDGVRVTRSLRRSCRRYHVTLDHDFAAVVRACADPRRPHGWITADILAAYTRLHDLGWAHSVEVWDEGGRLVGGLYGVTVGGLFAGESMFHRATDASKVALVHLVGHLRASGATLLDVQWLTPHLASLGAVAVSRDEYLGRLDDAVAEPGAAWLRADRPVGAWRLIEQDEQDRPAAAAGEQDEQDEQVRPDWPTEKGDDHA